MEAPPTKHSTDKITAWYAGLRSLHAPSVIAEAARLLDALHETADTYGHPRNSYHLGGLTTAAAEATAGKHGSPPATRSLPEITTLHAALGSAFLDEGLTQAVSRVRMGTAVEPLTGGLTWGLDGRTGLAVALYSNSGWELMVNQPRTRVFTIHAPATPDGAREVAAIVHGILRGDLPDPFRSNSR